MIVLHPTTIETHFGSSRAKLDRLVGRLSAEETRQLPHGEVERLIEIEGREVLRQLFEDHLALRHAVEPVQESVEGSDGLLRTHRRERERQLETIFGTVTVWRWSYEGRGVEGLRPLDGELNLPPESYSHGVEQRVAGEVAKSSFEETVKEVSKTTGAQVAKRQVEEISQRAAQDFDAFYDQRAEAAQAAPPAASSLVVITSDGKGVITRTEDLRPATRKAAEKGRHKCDKRLSKGEKRHRKRMSTVAAVYTIEPFVRTPEEVVEEMARGEAAARRPRPENKRVWASLEKEPEQVLEDAFAEATARDPDGERRWVALVDGNKTQLAIIKELAAFYGMFGVSLTIVIDIVHVLEYLWKAAFAFHEAGTPEAEEWVTERLERILRGEARHVAGGMRRSATRRGLSAQERLPVDACARYLLGYQAFLRYDEYLADGLPISTGVIEGACRHLVENRMNLTGARWSLQGAEGVLRLRSLVMSGDFEEYWRFHGKREYERNHEHLYPKVIELRPPAADPAELSHVGGKAAA
jgi:hypothetical protein